MAQKPAQRSAEEIARMAGDAVVASHRQFVDESVLEPRTKRVRSARGVDKNTWTQVCFRLEPDRHVAIKLECVKRGIDIGVFMDDLLRKGGF